MIRFNQSMTFNFNIVLSLPRATAARRARAWLCLTFVISRQRRARSTESNAARLSRKHDRRADPQRAAAEGGAEEGMGQ